MDRRPSDLSEEQRRQARARLEARRRASTPPPSPVKQVLGLILGNLRLILIALVILVLLFALVSGIRSCRADRIEEAPVEASPATEQQAAAPEETGPVNLPEWLDADIRERLLEKAETNGDVNWIIHHADLLTEDGDAVQRKLLKLASKDDKAVLFVRYFPDKYPAATGEPYTDEITPGTVPLLQQWDGRWGYTVYSSTAFALTGCGPTCLSMVYMGLTGDASLTPYEMGKLAAENGYMTEFDGTDQTFLSAYAPSLGLDCQQVSIDSSSLQSALQQGKVVICNVGPGDFTENGHYLVITGLTDSGEVTINDPFSSVNSSKTWDIGTILSQTKLLYAYSKA